MYLRYGDLSWDTVESDELVNGSRSRRTGTNGHSAPRLGRMIHRLPVVRLNGVELHAITESGCIRHILDHLDAGRGGVVVTPNLDHLRRCTQDMNFGALVAEADLVVADGMPLVWASRLQGTPLPERVAGSDLVSSLSAAANERGRSIFLLGGAPGTADGAARVLRERHPTIQIVGTYCPPYGFDKDETELQKMEQMVIEAGPHIIYVALGSPKQELLIDRLRKKLPNSWWLGVGNSFSFLSGDVRRAPLWMQRYGLEWVHRLIQEPKRLFRRYIVLGIPFATSLLGKAILIGLPARLNRAGKTAEEAVDGTAAAAEVKQVPVAKISTNGNGNQLHHRGNGSNGADHERALLTLAELPRPHGRVARMASRSDGLAKLRSLVLLGGSVRPTPLTTTIGRAVLDLPLDDNGSILTHWLVQAALLSQHVGLPKLPVRVLVDWSSPEPVSAAAYHLGTLRVERDRTEYRGTGGVLHDLAGDYEDDDLILVANAQQVLLEPLVSMTDALDQMHADVSVVSHLDGTPSGLMLVRCATLRLIAGTGFVDMKEQALPAIASQFAVKAMPRKRPTGLPVRSLADYIMALRHYHRRRTGTPGSMDPLAEDWRPTFAIIEDGASVDPLARIHDSVVLQGGRVEPGAVLVRSIVCPGGVVRRDRTAVDQFVTDAPETRSRRRT